MHTQNNSVKYAKQALLSHERLVDLLLYNPLTGDFTWRVTRGGNAKANEPAGSVSAHGYHVIGVDRKIYKAHRLAWLYVTGSWPVEEIDHIDLNKLNNRIDNLREASRSQNAANQRAYSTNKSGFKGVSWYKRTSKWRAAIMVRGNHICIGYFDRAEDAADAYNREAMHHFGQFRNELGLQ